MIFRKHLDDELLVGHLEGSLSRWDRVRVRRHLHRCWSCRARQARFREQMHRVAEALEKQTFPGRERIEKARSEFYRRYRALEPAPRRGRKAPSLRLHASAPAGLRAAFALAAMALLAVSVWFAARPVEPPPAERVIASAQRFEMALLESSQDAVYQVVEVAISEAGSEEDVPQEGASQKAQKARLSVWSEPSENRFAAVWKSGGGEVQGGVWRPAADQAYAYRAGAGPAAEPVQQPTASRSLVLDLARAPRLDVESLEAALLDWLMSRRWTPVAFSREFAAFSAGQGAALSVRTRREPGKGLFLEVTAVKPLGERRVEFTLEVDAETYRPLLQRIVLATPERTMEIRLAVEVNRRLSPAWLTPAVFQPSVPVRRRIPERKAALSKNRSKAPRPAESRRAVSAAERRRTAVRAQHILHQQGVCLDGAIHVAQRPEQELVEIRGLVQPLHRKQELLNALQELAELPFVRVDLRTMEEAASLSSFPKAAPAPPDAEQAAQNQVVVRRQPSLRDELGRYFLARSPNAKAARERAARFSSGALAKSRSALMEAWALRKLAERYPPEKFADLAAESREMIVQMRRDHRKALREKLDALRAHAAPVLAGIADIEGFPGIASPASPETGGQPAAYGSMSWSGTALDLFAEVKATDRLITTLLAGTETLADADEASPASMLNNRQSLHRVLTGFQKSYRLLDALEDEASGAGPVPAAQTGK